MPTNLPDGRQALKGANNNKNQCDLVAWEIKKLPLSHEVHKVFS